MSDVIVNPDKNEFESEKFRAGKSIISIIILGLSQFLIGILIVIIYTIIEVIKGGDAADPVFMEMVITKANPILLLSAGIGSTIVIFLISRFLAWDTVKKTEIFGMKKFSCGYKKIFFWSMIGVFLAFAYIFVIRFYYPINPSQTYGPIATAVSTNYLSRISWSVIALFYAPIVEEYFFRGLLFRGFSNSWGPIVSGIIVTTVFVLLHLTETIHFWPATLGIIILGIVTLVARITSKSLWPAIGLHFAYNMVIVISVVTGLGLA